MTIWYQWIITDEFGKEVKTKICRDCGLEKTIDRFVKSPKSKEGRARDCKECHNKKRRV